MRVVSLLFGLGLFWLLLSGLYTGLLLALGALSCALVAWLCRRMNIVDEESQPHQVARRILPYWLWLSGEALRSNLAVTRILLRRQPIQPVTGPAPAPLVTDLARATLANSITLTPGTLSMDVHDDSILVHALDQHFLDELRAGEMSRRVHRLEGDA